MISYLAILALVFVTFGTGWAIAFALLALVLG